MMNLLKQASVLGLLLSLLIPLSAQRNINQANVEVTWGAEVNTYSGNLSFQLPTLSYPSGILPIDMCLHYNSECSDVNLGLGNGWSFSYNLFYEKIGDDISLHWGNGQADTYVKNAGAFEPPVGIFHALGASGDTIRVVQKGGKAFVFGDSTKKKVSAISDPRGADLQMSYGADSLLDTVTDSYGRVANLGWSGGKLRTIWDDNGAGRRSWFLGYEGEKLVKMSQPGGGTFKFQYDEEGRLIEIENPLGDRMNINYHPNGAVAHVQVPEVGLSQTYEYNFATRINTLKENVGGNTQTTTYEYDASGRLIHQIGSCCGFDRQWDYDPAGNLIKKTDALGAITSYTYDGNGNMLSEKKPQGVVTTYTYDPIYNRVSSMTDPEGNSIMYTYDAVGNRIREDWPEGIVKHYDYNTEGLLVEEVNGNGDTTRYAYDSYGNRNRITRPNGSVEQFTHNSRGNKIAQIDALGHETTFGYDDLGRMTRSTAPLPFTHTVEWTYDAMGNQTRITEPLGKVTHFTYDALSRVTQISMPLGVSHTYTYDSKNRTSYTDPRGSLSTYTYDSFNRMSSTTDADGTRNYTYDAVGNLLSQTDRLGNLLQFEYDSLYRRTAIINALLDTSKIVYDNNGNITEMTDFEGDVTSYVYDGMDRRTSTTRSPGDITTFEYDKNDKLIKEIDPLGNATEWIYDERDLLIGEVLPSGDTSKTFYDLNGQKIRTVSPSGGTTDYTYDAIGRPLTTLEPDGELTSFVYDEQNNMTSVTFPNGNVHTYTYDALGRKVAESDLLGSGLTYTYDANNNVTRMVTAVNDTFRFTYDAQDRKTATLYPLGDSMLTYFDSHGNLIREKDRNGNFTHYLYDALHRLTCLVNGLGDSTFQTYDKMDRLLTVKDPLGNVTSYTYDGLGRMTRTDYPDGSHEARVYDAADRLVKERTRSGDTIRSIFDPMGRLSLRDFASTPDEHYTYTPLGFIDSMWSGMDTTTFTYSLGGKTLTESRAGLTTTYAYDALAGTRTLTYPSGRVITETRDLRARLDDISEGASPLLDLVYDAADRKSMQTYGNGNLTSYTYDANGNLTRLTHNNPTAFWDVTYGYDNSGSIISEERLHRTSHSQTYLYDDIHQVTETKKGNLVGTSIPVPSDADSYTYDKSGNRLTFNNNGSVTTYTSNAVNQYTALIGTGAYTPGFDTDANQTYDGNLYYEYDDMGRLSRACSDAACSSVVTTYTYDPLGRLIRSVSGASTTAYYYDDARIIEERTGTTTQTYVYGNELDEVVNMEIGTVDYYYHLNHLGSAVALSSSTGALVERYDYDVFGSPQFLSPTYLSQPGSTVDNPHLFAGRRYDAGTGLYYLRARWYEPNTGRFLQPDPAGFGNTDPRTLHRYAYSANDPINNVDPSGKNWKAVRHGSQNGRPRFNIMDENGQRVGVYVIGFGALLLKGNRINQTTLDILHAHAAAEGCKIIGLDGLRGSVRWGGKKPPPDAPPPIDPKKFEKDKPDYIAITGQSLKKSFESGESASSAARVIDECTGIINDELDSITGIFGWDAPDIPKAGPQFGKVGAYNNTDGLATGVGNTIRVIKAVSDIKDIRKVGKALKESPGAIRNMTLTTTPSGKAIKTVIVDPKAAKDLAVNGGKLAQSLGQSANSIKKELNKKKK
jgi:RHS repeat-associated protein